MNLTELSEFSELPELVKDLPPHFQEDSQNLLQTANTISTTTSVLGLVNGMISTTILVLPCIALVAGSVSSVLLCLLFGLTTYYTAHLLVLHIG